MKKNELKRALACAVNAARSAGKLMRQNLGVVKKVNAATQHDVKLELDVQCQELIEALVLKEFPHTAILGEEGICGDQSSDCRWVIDPIDGTVNYAYGIPHACVSIALQKVNADSVATRASGGMVVGVVYDPFQDELWTASEGEPARLNGKKIQVSDRSGLAETIIGTGFAKEGKNISKNLALFQALLPRVRKMRLTGSAALALTYVASGRFDAYVESGLRLWDIAAGRLILDCAGGSYTDHPFGKETAYHVVACNQAISKKIHRLARSAWGIVPGGASLRRRLPE
jgi:myo-inositol-1(or 4)-monophosphatase